MIKNYAMIYCDFFECDQFQAVIVGLNIVDGKIETDIDVFPKSWEQDGKKTYCPSHKSRLPSEYELPSKEKCKHNWVMDGHNAGDPICSKCYSRE